MNGLDYTVAALLLFSFWRGWAKGIFRSLIGPLSLFGCLMGAWWYYQQTGSVMPSLAIAILGPLSLNIFFWVLFLILQEEKQGNVKRVRLGEILSRLCGGIFHCVWTSVCLGLVMVFFMTIPFRFPFLDGPRDLVLGSKSLAALKAVMGSRGELLGRQRPLVEMDDVPAHMEGLKETPEYLELMEDERVREVFSDPEIREMVQNGDFTGLFANARVQEIMSDPQLMIKFFRFQQVFYDADPEAAEGGGDAHDIHKDH
jgi:hypothetical protein